MIIRIGDKLLELSEDDLNYMYIDEGMEGTIYRLGNKALKIHDKFPGKAYLEEDEAKELSKIDTKRIVLPKELIYDDNDKYIGYSTDFIDNCSLKNISKLSVREFTDEVDLIYKDLITLSDNFVDVDDYTLNNVLFDGGIHFIDPGSYTFVKSDRFLLSDNRYRFNSFLVDSLMPYALQLTKREASYLRNTTDVSEDLVDYFNYESEEKENLKKFVKRITR